MWSKLKRNKTGRSQSFGKWHEFVSIMSHHLFKMKPNSLIKTSHNYNSILDDDFFSCREAIIIVLLDQNKMGKSGLRIKLMVGPSGGGCGCRQIFCPFVIFFSLLASKTATNDFFFHFKWCKFDKQMNYRSNAPEDKFRSLRMVVSWARAHSLSPLKLFGDGGFFRKRTRSEKDIIPSSAIHIGLKQPTIDSGAGAVWLLSVNL